MKTKNTGTDEKIKPMMLRTFLGVVLLTALYLGGCTGRREGGLPVSCAVTFEDVTQAVGIRFTHQTGAQGKKLIPETVGSGCAFLDYNGDGHLDLFFVNSTDWPGPNARSHYPALYRNNGDGTFTDETKNAGLALDLYGMGVCAGDYDNDSHPDLYLTGIGPNHLFHNNGDGTFTDVTERAGVAGLPVEPGGLRWKWSTSAAWLDYDKDGKLDLFVCNYIKWTPQTDLFCGSNGVKSYCAPTHYEGVPSLLYHNLGDGRFQEVSGAMGIRPHAGKSFGVAVADFNNDGWPDLAVSNDTKENFLFLNQKGRRFEERGIEGGIALSPEGTPRAGMGIDAADWRNNGRFGLVVGNFSRERLSLYENDGLAVFQDATFSANVATASELSLTFGIFFFDYDLDGRQDLFAANGHIDDFIRSKESMISYDQLPLLYHGGPSGVFEEVGKNSGAPMTKKRVLRGCAHGDVDNDGDPDIAVVWNGRGGELWRNNGGSANGWVGLSLRGVRSNRDGIGAKVRLTSSGVTQTAYRHSGGSFLSESDPRLVFGLGSARRAESLEIEWPSGTISQFRNIAGGQYYTAIEGEATLQP